MTLVPHRCPSLTYILTFLENCVDDVCNCVQDAREMLAELRELKFALEESNEVAASLQSELAAARVKHKREVDLLSAASNESKEHLQSELATAQVSISLNLSTVLC